MQDLISVLKSNKSRFQILKSNNGIARPISHITADSRRIKSGTLFVAIRGEKADGHLFLDSLPVDKIAAVIVQSPESFDNVVKKFPQLSIILVDNTRAALSFLCNWKAGDPSQKLKLLGVTGTNGKTTTTHILEFLLNHSQTPTAVMGTIDHHFRSTVFPTDMTTPGPEGLYSRLDEFIKLGAKAVAMEVSSHALAQSRTADLQFDGAIFTNLTRDHLDFHHTFESYFQSKLILFNQNLYHSSKDLKVAVVNDDDDYSRRVPESLAYQLIRVGQNSVDHKFHLFKSSLSGLDFEIQSMGKKWHIQLPMIGLHNIYNFTQAFLLLHYLNLNPERAISHLSNFGGVRGRLEKVPNSNGLRVFVDYAHTDDALENVLRTLRPLADREKVKVITVFGCGGDRDKGKRPLMATVAQKYSHHVVVTSDNPRTEDPMSIINDIKKGFSSTYSETLVIEADRRRAIHQALDVARPGDVILIAGKGHEDYQIIGTEKRAFSDVQVVKEYLK